MLKSVFAMLCVSLLSVSLQAAEIETAEALCPVAKTRAVNAAQSVAHAGGKVFFCCGNCKAAFEKDASKFTARANHQLVVTKQATQKACPFSGGPTDDDQSVTVAKAKVKFCCGNCQGKAAKMDEADQIDALFSKTAFNKGFEVKK